MSQERFRHVAVHRRAPSTTYGKGYEEIPITLAGDWEFMLIFQYETDIEDPNKRLAFEMRVRYPIVAPIPERIAIALAECLRQLLKEMVGQGLLLRHPEWTENERIIFYRVPSTKPFVEKRSQGNRTTWKYTDAWVTELLTGFEAKIVHYLGT